MRFHAKREIFPHDPEFQARLLFNDLLNSAMLHRTFLLFAAAVLGFLSGCESARSYSYRYVPGETATVENGHAVAPPAAPPVVHAAIAAGNRIAGLPYSYGGGHTRGLCSAYDCSGAASYVLCEAGLLDEPTTSHAFRRYGSGGEGKWISVCARKGHVFLVVAGLRFDTGWGRGATGPRWTTRSRPMNGAVIRHPRGL